MERPEGKPGAGEPPQVEVSLSVVVCDPEALRAYAQRRYAACWFDSEWKPADLAQAVLEALVISNENPSPADYGIEIVEAQANEQPAQPVRHRGAVAARGPAQGRD
jgi:hypothetical protein